jgi:regulatory Fis family protein
MLTLEVRRRPGTGAEMFRIAGGTATVGASSGNEVVVRARGVYGRHVRLFERDGSYHLDLFKGIETVHVNGREFFGGTISVGDRITIGEATITVVEAAPARPGTPVEVTSGEPPLLPTATAAPTAATAVSAVPGTAVPTALPVTEVEYRGMRLSAYRLCRTAQTTEELASELTDFLDRELPPSEWAVGEFSPAAGFRPLASTFRENPMLPPRMIQDLRSGERLTRAETVTGVLTLIVEPASESAGSVGILVREAPRLAARAVLFLEELTQLAGIAFAGMGGEPSSSETPARHAPEVAVAAAPAPEPTLAEQVLRQTDDLKKIVETVEREVIDRAMRRVEGNQSRGAQVLNISRGSLIAKLKEFSIPDYRYLRRERGRRG